MTQTAIDGTLNPVTHDLGAFKVRRVLPARGLTMVGPFCFVDQFGPGRTGPGEGMDVRPHPHIGLSTVTWIFEGAIDHRDSLGTFATIHPGQVNLMTAGRGIVHSERSPASERAGGAPMYGMQTWLALPDAKEETEPAFEQVAGPDKLPVVDTGGVRAQVIMGTLWGATAATTCHAPTIYAEINLEPGGAIPIDAEADERALMLVGGGGELEGAAMQLYTLYVIKPGHAATLRSAKGGKAMLLGGGAFATPRRVWWNFVSSRQDRIDQAAADWVEGRFPKVEHDPEFIPLPETPLTNSDPI
jgi:redox-sensitive bicupin YhaK (pirin superfamily)